MDPTWYRNLRNPEWTPPTWVFPAMWIPLKNCTIAQVAVWLVWKSRAEKPGVGTAIDCVWSSLRIGKLVEW
ncbi:hypothetical protein WJX77_009322 [Trebouxia sp. C0004]